MRLFFALWPPPDTAQALANWAEEVARDVGGKPVAAEKIHLTLAFLGDADPEKAIAADLGVTPALINIKAATTEKLGFIGRGEGIAAQAVALLE